MESFNTFAKADFFDSLQWANEALSFYYKFFQT